MNQKMAKEVRNAMLEVVDGVDFTMVGGFEAVGRTSEGIAFKDVEGNVVVVKVIVKSEAFDVEDAIAEFDEKAIKAEEKAAAKAKKVVKELAKKAKAKEEEAKAEESEGDAGTDEQEIAQIEEVGLDV